ncbi:MAG: VWA domain-containing protein [Candidatus Bathyarchaeota archaeon]|nr:VWA domain-containing protein [Candidatus Bathyarchaeota archaeon]
MQSKSSRKIAVILASILIISSLHVPYAFSQTNLTPNRTTSPTRVMEDETIRITIELEGAGDISASPVDTMMVIDKSASMAGDKIADAKTAAKALLTLTNELDRAGLISFGSSIKIKYELAIMNSTNKEDLEDEIDDITTSGQTNIYDAIIATNDLLNDSPRQNVPKVQILLTDGAHNYPTTRPDSDFEDLAEDTRDQGITIFTIGLGVDTNEERLGMIANITGGRFFYAPTSDDLPEIFRDIARMLALVGTDIVVTERIPDYLTYNEDASKDPDERNDFVAVPLGVSDSRPLLELKWNVGRMWLRDEWNVTYTVKAEDAVDTSGIVSFSQITYKTREGQSVTIDLYQGLVFHNISLTDLIIDPTNVIQGDVINITATVDSEGMIQDTFPVDIRYDSTLLNRQTVTLSPGESKNVTYSWNTTGVEVREYNITVTADPDENIWEQDRSDNTDKDEVRISTQSNLIIFLLIGLFFLIIAVAGVIGGYLYETKGRRSQPDYRWYFAGCSLRAISKLAKSSNLIKVR